MMCRKRKQINGCIKSERVKQAPTLLRSSWLSSRALGKRPYNGFNLHFRKKRADNIRPYNDFRLYFQSEAYGKSRIHFVHGIKVKLAHFVFKAAFVDSSYLFEQHDAVLGKTAFVCLHFYVSRQVVLVALTGYRSSYNSRAVSVSHIVLDNKYRSDTALFRTYHRAEVGIIYFSAFD
jgi:hypothetical protein